MVALVKNQEEKILRKLFRGYFAVNFYQVCIIKVYLRTEGFPVTSRDSFFRIWNLFISVNFYPDHYITFEYKDSLKN